MTDATGVRDTYLDHASTAPLHPAAREALLAAFDEGWADPVRSYSAGRRARLLLDAARQAVADVLGARPDEVSFPPSGTDAVTRALSGVLQARRRTGPTLVTSAVEHSCVLAAGRAHEAGGGRTVLVPVARTGRVHAGSFAAEVGATGVAAASLQAANHEVGTRQPVAEVAAACRAAGVPLHVDAAVLAGREPVTMDALGADLLTASARKWGGPPGVGLLVVRRALRFVPLAPPAGPESVALAVAAAAALQARAREVAQEGPRLAGYVQRVRTELPRLVPDLQLHGDPDPAGRAPHIVGLSCLYVDGEALMIELDRAGIAVTSGSSCTSDTLEPSHVLAAMGVLTSGNVRVSFGRESTEADVDRLLAVLPAAVGRIRDAAGVVGL